MSAEPPPPRALTRTALARGAEQLAAVDADLAALLDRLGLPPLWGRRPGFPTLIRIILEQQVSLASARTLYERLRRTVGEVTPRTIHARGEAGLRDFGLTRQKARYCYSLAERVLDGRLDLSAVARGPDGEGRRRLLAVPGLGPWSVDVYYLMALRRPDVWPRGDLALAVALRDIKDLRGTPSTREQEALAEPWRPWRSVAARLLWSHYLAERGR